MIRFIFSISLGITACTAAAETPTVVYVEPVGGVYTQTWTIQDAVYYAAGIRTVTVKSEGKLGAYNGELYVDCRQAARSKWLSVEDLVLEGGGVPIEAIRGIRAALCDNS